MSTVPGPPPYNVARGQSDTLSLIPPVVFTGVTLRYIPLPARMDQLQRFIDRFLNLGTRTNPRGDHWFDVAAPLVVLTLVDYGRMAVAAINEGWTAQYEIAFQVPLVWYERNAKGGFELAAMAWASPFMFVDNVLSMNTGREVYGWEKTLASITTSPDAWTQRPMGTEPIVSVSSHRASHAHSGEREPAGKILSITQQAVGRIPPDFRQWLDPLPQVLKPLVSMPRVMMEIVRRVFEGPGATPLDPFDPRIYFGWLSNRSWRSADEVPPMGTMARQGLGYLDALIRMATGPANTINLKQFRAAGEAGYRKAAYQAITNAPFGFLSVDAMGPMGPANAALGQRDGGLRVLIPPSNFDIVASMGLEVASRTGGPQGESVDVIVPIYPFWMRGDMGYGVGENVEIRTIEGGDGGRLGADAEQPDYNTALGAASQQRLGPFESPRSTVRVLPLQADRATLGRFVDEYLNALELPRADRFELWGDFVYMVVHSLDDTVSSNDPIQRRNVRWVSFHVPVRWYRTEAGQANEDLVGVGLVAPFSFSDDPELAITLTEVGGTPTMVATIEGPPDVWLNDSGPDPTTPQTLMRLSTEVLPALNVGAKVEQRVVAEVLSGAALHRHDDQGWRRVAAEWGESLRGSHQAMIDGYKADPDAFCTLWTLALEVLANGKSFRSLTLKQFRDAAQPDRACYQALVQGSMTVLGEIHDMRELPQVVHVRLPRYPTLPIAERLGLVPKATKVEREGLVDYFQPMRPFWLRAATRYDTGRCVYRRTTGRWTEIDPPDGSICASTELGRGLLDVVNARGQNLQRLRETVQAWRREAFSAARRITASEARHAIETVEPQPIVEAILSKEWAHPKAGPLGQKPLFCVPSESIDGREGRQFFQGWQTLGETDRWCFLEAIYCNSPGTEKISQTLQDDLLPDLPRRSND